MNSSTASFDLLPRSAGRRIRVQLILVASTAIALTVDLRRAGRDVNDGLIADFHHLRCRGVGVAHRRAGHGLSIVEIGATDRAAAVQSNCGSVVWPPVA